MNRKILYLIREDLRISDNPALSSAARDGCVMIVYIQDENQTKPRGSAYNWWTHHSLIKLNLRYQKLYNCQIHFFKGTTSAILQDLITQNSIDYVYLNRSYDTDSLKLEEILGKNCKSFPANLLHEPDTILNGSQRPYQIFTAYWNKARFAPVRPTFPQPEKINSLIPVHTGVKGEELGLLSSITWYKKFDLYWQPGENNAKQILDDFIKTNLSTYHKTRDFPYLEATSKISPFLAHGEISIVEIWHKINDAFDEINGSAIEKFLSEIGWREFSYHLLFHFPKLQNEPMKKNFINFQWSYNAEFFEKWKRGSTGYPLVDAGMRELWETGWMHNRTRMIVGSFLTKNLLINWTKGEQWFWDCLVDADYANNPVAWQWVAGCGCDAGPYFRIFNPLSQATKFDPQSIYINKWTKQTKNSHNFANYFAPIVDLKKSRDCALIKYKEIS